MAEPSDEKSNPFTQFYAQLLHQGNMLQDLTRTGTYRHAFLSNSVDFLDKVVLDVGTGTGILAMFAVQAGARKVYAVEASESAVMARILVEANGYANKIEIIHAKLEEVLLPELVDVIISEPIGFLLGESHCSFVPISITATGRPLSLLFKYNEVTEQLLCEVSGAIRQKWCRNLRGHAYITPSHFA